jgi:hypothetical protein
MPKYKIKMNYVEAKEAEFVVEAADPDELHDLIGELDLDFVEENAGFTTVSYESPIIEEYEKVNKNTPVHQKMQKAMQDVKKAWEAL